MTAPTTKNNIPQV